MSRIREAIILISVFLMMIQSVSAISNVQHSVDETKITLTYQGNPPFWINIRSDTSIGQAGGYLWAKTYSNTFSYDMGFANNPSKRFFYGIKDVGWSSTFGFSTEEVNPIEIGFTYEVNDLNVIVTGGVSFTERDITKIEWDWGDGSIDEQWFPAEHTYVNKDNYEIKVTALDNAGNTKTIKSKVRLLPVEDITIHGDHISFIDFPEDFFDGSDITPNRVVEIADVIYNILKDAHHNSLIQDRISFVYSPEDCGAFSNSREKKVTICKSVKPLEYHPWGVYAHEMSHNMAGQNPQFLYLAEHGYSAFFDEHQAEINPEYVYQTIKNNPYLYGISNNELDEIKKSNIDNRNIQKQVYENYINSGKPFYLLQDDVAKATATGQALSNVIFDLVSQSDVQGIERFNRLIKDDVLIALGFENVPNQEEFANYITAAHSIAFGKDLRNEFKNRLNFPIDNNKYNTYYNLLEGYID